MNKIIIIVLLIVVIILLIGAVFYLLLERRKLQFENARLQQSDQGKSDFLAKMSYEVRTSLNGLKGMLDIVSSEDTFETNMHVRKARLSAEYLASLLNNVLDMSKIEKGEIQFSQDWVWYADWLELLDGIIRPLAESKGINFQVIYNEPLHKAVFMDSTRMTQIIVNLLSNSVKYNSINGDVYLQISEEDIGDGMERVTLVVRDTGCGMSSEVLKTAFEPCHDLKNESPFSAGKGLGLAVTKELVERMGGDIQLDSAVDVGTTVILHFDLKYKDEEKENYGFVPKGFRNQKFYGLTALIVEDNKVNLEIAKRQLEALGMVAVCAENGQAAVDIYRKSEEGDISIIFMDVMMPVMDGLTAAQKIRQLDRRDAKEVAIVAMTANAFVEDVEKSIESGMNAHLSKPYEMQQLVSMLELYLG